MLVRIHDAPCLTRADDVAPLHGRGESSAMQGRALVGRMRMYTMGGQACMHGVQNKRLPARA